MKLSIKNKHPKSLSALFLMAVLAGCETPPTVPPTPPVAVSPPVVAPPPVAPPPAAPPPTAIVVVPKTDPTPPTAANDGPGEKDLAEGQNLYDSGDYKGAQRKLLAAQNAAGDATLTKQTSMKLLAFTYCLTNQRVQCKQQFTNLLKINPKFELTKSEAGHPLWGPVFAQTKKEQAAVKR